MSDEPLFTVAGDGSTDAPSINPDDYEFVSYFENKTGDHLVFTYDAEEEEGRILTSKDEWENATTITQEEIMDGDFHLHFRQFEGEGKWIHGIVLALQARVKIGSL